MPETTTDFCVIGGGPAGMTLALLLLRSGCRVTVVERSRSLAREYRGEILQPGGLAVLDALGVLAPARERGGYELARFRLSEGSRTLIDIDYRRLGPPYDYLLSVPQAHLLQALLDACRAYESFHYLPGEKISELILEKRVVRGVVTSGRRTIGAHCVVGADGRYSKTRKLAGLDYRRSEDFDFDVLWFRLPAAAPAPVAHIFRAEGTPMLAYPSYPGSVQLGMTLRHKGYADLSRHGLGHVKQRLRWAAPPYAELIDEHITSMRDFSLLDVFAGDTRPWVRAGLALIGDAAHTHSPLGAQGINLAVQDAAVIHPILLETLRSGAASTELLAEFEANRRPAIDRLFRIQRLQGKAMLSRSRLAGFLRPKAAALVGRGPIAAKITEQIAYGRERIRITETRIEEDEPQQDSRIG
ncbi:FAD-dependent monooxygenase [Sciscionella marina]|uniref:FAD-dependent monooxygenase n=1 Tax=Sciscionella marina TaxID=508770 RepID=UPI000366F583|nr:FAD-dependent monooxygenase [Sciscionella marina]